MRYLAAVAVFGACASGPGDSPWLLETPTCTFQTTDAVPEWDGCRVYWAGEPTRTMMVELINARSSGSFVVPGSSWWRLSYTDESVGQEMLALRNASNEGLPPMLTAEQIDLSPIQAYAVSGHMEVRTNEIGDHEVELAGTVQLDIRGSGLSGTERHDISVSAHGPPSQVGPADVITP
jgi:hypothetical protein